MAKKKTPARKPTTTADIAKLEQSIILLMRLACTSRDIRPVDKTTLADMIVKMKD